MAVEGGPINSETASTCSDHFQVSDSENAFSRRLAAAFFTLITSWSTAERSAGQGAENGPQPWLVVIEGVGGAVRGVVWMLR